MKHNYIPTDKTKLVHKKVTNPRIGINYHLSWAYVGAKFKLISLDEDGIHCYLDNPKNKRKELIKAKIEDLRDLNFRNS